jgi:hypothetical protein
MSRRFSRPDLIRIRFVLFIIFVIVVVVYYFGLYLAHTDTRVRADIMSIGSKCDRRANHALPR